MREDNVVEFGGITKLDLSSERVLQAALEAKLDGVVIIGWSEDGSRYFASSYASGSETLWLLETAKKDLLAIEDEI